MGRLFALVFVTVIMVGCSAPRSALNWNKLDTPYHDRVLEARAKQLEGLRGKGECVKSELERTEEALLKAVKEIFDGKEAEIKAIASHPLADRGFRQWRVEELILLYNPEIMAQLAGLDQMATSPNLLLAILNQLQLSGSAALLGGIFEIKSSQAGNSELIFNSEGRSVYETRLGTSLSLGGFFQDSKSLIAFEREFIQFRNKLMARHAILWPIVEDYKAVDAVERERRTGLLIKELLGRP